MGYGYVKMRDLVRTDEGRAQAQAALDRWYPRGLDMFGRANSRRAARYVHWGLKHRSNETARAQYMAEVSAAHRRAGADRSRRDGRPPLPVTRGAARGAEAGARQGAVRS